MPETLAPELRFKSFSEPWKVTAFGELYAFQTTNSYSRSVLSDDKGDVYNIHYGDIHTRFKTCFDISKELVPRIDPELANDSFSKDQFCREGDLVVADASEDYNDIGKTIELVALDGKRIVAGLHTLHARPKNGALALGFAAFWMQSKSVRYQVKVIAQGTKVLGISAGRLAEVEACIPTLPEQQKIAAFLGAVDRKIQQLKRKQALLEQYKKGVVQQLFSQEIRFKRENGGEFPEWEEKRLGDVVTFTKGKGVSKSDIVKGGATKCIRYGELYTTYGEVIDDVVSATDVDPSQLLLSKRNDVIIPASGETQLDIATASCVMHDGIALGGDLNVMRTKENGVFLAYYLNGAKRNAIAELAQGNAVVHLYAKQLQGVGINLPCLEEQSRIAGFLMALDAKVAGVAQAVAAAQQWKKGLLQGMFV